MADEMNATDWVSAISSAVAAFVGIITLLIVYIGAKQLLSESRIYRYGLSWRSLGSWQSTVAKRALFGLERHISSPTVSPKLLIQSQWKPHLSLLAGIRKSKDACVEKGELVQANATWVNFMQAMGLSPSDNRHYEMQDASEFVNGIVPMHWTGSDLVGVCSTLGFYSYEDPPCYTSPMQLPMQWEGPLGWLQFRSSASVCVVEFKPFMPRGNHISANLHLYYDKQSTGLVLGNNVLQSRLWNSMGAFLLPNNKALVLDGAIRCGSGSPGAPYELCPAPGSFSTTRSRDWACMWGLDVGGCQEYRRTPTEDVDYERCPYRLGDLHMDSELLGLMKEALMLVRPDGFDFSPGHFVSMYVCEAYRNIEDQLDLPGEIFPQGFTEVLDGKVEAKETDPNDTNSAPTSEYKRYESLRAAMVLCNELQESRKMALAELSVDDMRLLATAASLLQGAFLAPEAGSTNAKPRDLVWAMLYCGDLLKVNILMAYLKDRLRFPSIRI